MNDDFETPEALASLFELIKGINIFQENSKLTSSDQKALLDYLKEIDKVLGILFPEEETLSEELQKLIEEREEARKNKDWDKSDELRDELLKKGVIVEDTPEGTIWKKAD